MNPSDQRAVILAKYETQDTTEDYEASVRRIMTYGARTVDKQQINA